MNILKEINYFYYRTAMYELQLMNGGDYYNGLSYNSLLYLNVIDQTEDCTVSKLAEKLNITKSAVTLKLNELTRQGVVAKEQSQSDKRVFFIRLSPRVKDTVGIYDGIFGKIEEALRKKYTERQLNEFGEILHEISGYEWRKIQDE